MTCLQNDGHIHCWHEKNVAHITIKECCRCLKEEENCNHWINPYQYYDSQSNPFINPNPIWVTCSTAGGQC